MANIELVTLIPEAPADNGLNLRLLGTILALYEDFEERFQRIETDIILLTENCTSAAICSCQRSAPIFWHGLTSLPTFEVFWKAKESCHPSRI